MYLTHPDQMARLKDMERDDVMFPKGVKQMLGFIYAMDGEVYRRMTWHARMMILRESFDRGYCRPFPLHKINMTGLDPIQVNGECAGLRGQVESLLCGKNEMYAVLAKFGTDEKGYVCLSVETLAEGLRDHLTRGWRKAQRSRQYCSDLLWHDCCGSALYEKKYNVMAISRRNSMAQQTVSKDLSESKLYLSAILASAYRIVEKKFSDGTVLP